VVHGSSRAASAAGSRGEVGADRRARRDVGQRAALGDGQRDERAEVVGLVGVGETMAAGSSGANGLERGGGDRAGRRWPAGRVGLGDPAARRSSASGRCPGGRAARRRRVQHDERGAGARADLRAGRGAVLDGADGHAVRVEQLDELGADVARAQRQADDRQAPGLPVRGGQAGGDAGLAGTGRADERDRAARAAEAAVHGHAAGERGADELLEVRAGRRERRCVGDGLVDDGLGKRRGQPAVGERHDVRGDGGSAGGRSGRRRPGGRLGRRLLDDGRRLGRRRGRGGRRRRRRQLRDRLRVGSRAVRAHRRGIGRQRRRRWWRRGGGLLLVALLLGVAVGVGQVGRPGVPVVARQRRGGFVHRRRGAERLLGVVQEVGERLALLDDAAHRRRAEALVAIGVGQRRGGRAQRGLVVAVGEHVQRTAALGRAGRAGPGVDLDHLALEEAAHAADQAGALTLDDRVRAELLADPGQHLLEAAAAVGDGLGGQVWFFASGELGPPTLVTARAHARIASGAGSAPTMPTVSTRRPGGASW
jgi:hypothetical protein